MVSSNYLKRLSSSMHSAIINGEIHHGIPSEMVYVSDESELASFTNTMPVGTLAATYGWGSIWQLDADRNWVSV